MKLNSDCIRDILLLMEKADYEEVVYADTLFNSLQNYDKNTISYSVKKMVEAGLITAAIVNGDDRSEIEFLDDITYYGHEFLNNVRSDTIWKNVKEIGTKIEVNSINALTQIATGVISTLINHQLGI